MKVLSLFDGIACGRVALARAGVVVDYYYASEISPHSIQVAARNYPDIVQVGDVRKVSFRDGVLRTEKGDFEVGRFDLVMGGSPCQDLTNISRGNGLRGEKSYLFHQFCRVVRETEPRFFFLENVRFKNLEARDEVSQHLRVEPVVINSELFSAQLRPRFYWTNIPVPELPPDKGLTLRDVIDEGDSVDEADTYANGEQRFKDFLKQRRIKKLKIGDAEVDATEKLNKTRANRYRLEHVRALDQKSRCLTTQCGNVASTSGSAVYVNGRLRRLSPEEAERLQTLPVGYTAGLKSGKRYFVVGDGWTVDVIAHIFKGMLPVERGQASPALTKRNPVTKRMIANIAAAHPDAVSSVMGEVLKEIAGRRKSALPGV